MLLILNKSCSFYGWVFKGTGKALCNGHPLLGCRAFNFKCSVIDTPHLCDNLCKGYSVPTTQLSASELFHFQIVPEGSFRRI